MAAMPVAQGVAVSMRTASAAPVQFRQRRCLHSRGASAALMSSTRNTTFSRDSSRLSRRHVRCSSSKPTSTATDEPAEPAGDKSREEPSSIAASVSAASSKKEASKGIVTEESIDSIGAELARLRKAKEEAEPSGAGGFAQGVLEEVRLIEWPGFSSVLSTTGLVLAVIASATFAILIVNAILSEISDRIFSIEAVANLWGL